MSIPSPTQISITLLSKNEAQALYLIVEETLAQAGITVQDTHTKEITYGSIITQLYTEKYITIALSLPITPAAIRDIADLVAIGLIIGFAIRGDIDLDKRIINNIYPKVENE